MAKLASQSDSSGAEIRGGMDAAAARFKEKSRDASSTSQQASALKCSQSALKHFPFLSAPQERQRRPFSRPRRKARSFFKRWKSISIRNTWLNPLIIMLTVALGFVLNPTPSNPLHSGLLLSYPEPVASASTPLQYGKGPLDLAFVAFYIVVFSFTREFIMQRLIRPLAIYLGVHRPAKQIRFMEQMYTALYMGIFGPYGLYVMSKTPVWYFNTRSMYEGFPHKTHSAIFKAYYLLQAAYWAQQAIVIILRLEKPRKDFRELVLHHIITVSLIALSYRFHFTYCGLAVYITHDISDFFLAISKSLNYIDSPIIGPFFAIFVCVWVYMRHYINIRILLSILIEFPTVGPFTMDWEAQQYKCRLSQVITFSLLATLQAVNLFWTFLILRIAKNIVFNSAFVDERSEDEDEEEVLEKVEPVVSAEGTKLLVNVVEEKHAEEIDDNENDDDYEKVSASETKKGQ